MMRTASSLILALCAGFALANATLAEDTANEEQEITATVGCYGCIFHGEGAKGCEAAVEIDGEVMLIEGEGKPNAHKLGMCKASKQCKLTGHVEGDKFIATKVEITEQD